MDNSLGRSDHPTYRYRLTWQDALAYEKLPKDMPGLQRATLYIWLALAGLLLIALPPELAGDINTPRFWVTGAALILIQWFIFVFVRAILRRNRARYRYPVPVEATLEQDADHFVVVENGRRRTVPFEDIGMMLPAASHLFMAVGRDLVIVPLVAFGDPGGVADMVGSIDGYMRDKYAGELAGADGVLVEEDHHHHHHPGFDQPS